MGVTKKDINTRPLVSYKWAEVRKMMATHLTGLPPEWLFINRRPLESTNEAALAYRVENFQPITKQSFNHAVGSIVETASHIQVSIEGIADSTSDYVNDLSIPVNNKTFSLEEYIVKYIGRKAELDPNGVIVILPVHPNDELKPDFREELPNFDSITNQSIEVKIDFIGSEYIHRLSEKELVYMAGEWLYKIEKGEEHYEPYFVMLTKEETSLLIPKEVKKGEIEYDVVPYYNNALSKNPFAVVGYNTTYFDDMQFMESTYSGAVAIGNEVLGVKSDEQICSVRFVYPEKFASVERCGFPGCFQMTDPTSKYNGIFVNADSEGNCSTCSGCSGAGYVQPDTSPLGTHFISKSDYFDQDGGFVPPLQFVTPPLESPRYLDEKWRKDFDLMENALFIMGQNMTNQSGDSKSYDLKEKVSVISRAVRNLYSIYGQTLNAIQGYLNSGEQDIEIITPPDFNISNTKDITRELAESTNTSSTFTSELTKELLLKKFGSSAVNRYILDFLELEDLYFGMTPDEILKTSISYPQGMRGRMQVVHDKGWAILNKISNEVDVLEIGDDELKRRFDEYVNRFIVVTSPESPIA